MNLKNNKELSAGTADEQKTKDDGFHVSPACIKPNVIGSAQVETKAVKTKPHFYAALLNPMQEIAKEMGYNLIIHGSMNRDFDLIAVAWVDNPKKEIELIKELDRFLRGSFFNNEQDYLFSILPGGRKSYVINLVRAEKWNGYQDAQYYLDISFTPLMLGSADR